MSIVLKRTLNNFELGENEYFKGICAEVLITNLNEFVLSCMLCEAKFRNFVLLKKHAVALHNCECLPSGAHNMETNQCVKTEFISDNEQEPEILFEASEALSQNSPEEDIGQQEVSWTTCEVINDITNPTDLKLAIPMEYVVNGDDETISLDLNEGSEAEVINTLTETITIESIDVTSKTSDAVVEDSGDKLEDKTIEPATKVQKMERRTTAPNGRRKSRPNNSNSERIHICPICSFAFTDKSNLKSHINRHSGIKNFECKECSKRFYTRTELQTHTRTHTGEKPYICASCGKGCPTAGELKVHERRHTNDRRYKCSYCEKRFFDSKHLSDHIVSHTQIRNYKCDICDSRFLRRKSLKSHIKIHENKREYVCNICGNAYNQKPALSIHIRSKHGVHIHKTDTKMPEV